MRNRPSFLKFLREIQKISRRVLTQRKKSCILRSNRLLTYCQAQEGVIHYESYRRQISAGSDCDVRYDCDIPWHFDKHGGSVLFSRRGGFRNRDWECQPYAYHLQSGLRRKRNGGFRACNREEFQKSDSDGNGCGGGCGGTFAPSSSYIS